jgi:molybdopterin/thiamine biosynthesis adenylyltransferase
MRKRAQFIEVKPRAAKRGNHALLDTAARLPNFIGGPTDAVARLRALTIFIVGVGSVGGRIAVHLARLGVAMLCLVDPKRFKPESVLTHDIEPREVDKFKALTSARRCKAISPATRVFAFNGPAEDLPLDAFADANLVVLATDNLAAEIEVGQRCVRLGKPLVQASVHGDTLTAQVRVFGNADGQGPCPVCGFGAVEWQMLNEHVRFSCDGFATT